MRQKDRTVSQEPAEIQAECLPTTVTTHRVMMEHSRHFLGLLTLDGTVVEVSPSVRALHAPTFEDVTGHPIWSSAVWRADDHERLRRAVAEAAQGEEANLQLQVTSAAGRQLIVDFSVRPIWEGGTISHLISEGHDRTLWTELEQQQGFLQAIIDNIPDGIAACDASGVLRVLNPASQALHGLREFSPPAAAWTLQDNLYQPDGVTPLELEKTPLYRALRGEVVQDTAVVIALRGQEPRQMLASGRQLISQTGETLGAVVAMHDVTRALEAEKALRESEAHWRNILHGLSEGIIEQDRLGHVVMSNPAAESLLGLTHEQLLGLAPIDPRWRTIHEDGRPFEDDEHPAMTALRTGESQENKVMGVHKPDGSLLWVLVNCRPLWRTGDSTAYAAISSLVDITRMKQTEAQLMHQSLHDALTGLPGTTLFRTRLEQALDAATRDPAYRFAVLYIDLDGFKTVNDALGHNIGDNLLVTVARQLEQCVRGSDTVARLGGDEFAVLFEHLSHKDDATELAKRVLSDLSITLSVGGREISVSASIGVVLSDTGRYARDLLHAADRAMYRAKAAGKARYHVGRP